LLISASHSDRSSAEETDFTFWRRSFWRIGISVSTRYNAATQWTFVWSQL